MLQMMYYLYFKYFLVLYKNKFPSRLTSKVGWPTRPSGCTPLPPWRSLGPDIPECPPRLAELVQSTCPSSSAGSQGTVCAGRTELGPAER